MRKFPDLRCGIRGSITSCMCIFTAVIILFNAVLTDCGRMLVMRESLKRKVGLCAESLAADFMRELQSEYGLYGLYYRDSEQRRNDAFEFVSQNESILTNVKDKLLYDGYTKLNLFDYDVNDVDLTYLGNITEPVVLKDNICGIMKYKVPADLLSGLLEKTEMFGESTAMYGLQSVCTQADDIRDRVIAEMKNVKIAIAGTEISDIGSVTSWKSLGSKSASIQIDAIEGVLQIGVIDAKTGGILKTEFETLKNTIQIFKEYNETAYNLICGVLELCDDIRDKTDEYYEEASELDFTSETARQYYESTEPTIKSLLRFVKNVSYTSALSALDRNIEIFNDVEGACNDVLLKLNSETDAPDIAFINNKLVSVKKIKDITCDMTLPEIPDSEIDEGLSDYDISEKKENCVKNAFDNAECIVIPEKVKSLLPSFEVTAESGGDISGIFDIFNGFDTDNEVSYGDVADKGNVFCNMIDGAKESIYINSYITSFFYCNGETVPDNRFFNAETEYIIAGGTDQQANVNNVFMQILGIRTVMNFVHILTDRVKLNFANQIGSAMSGATMGIGAPAYAFAIMGIWATAEAALDMATLKEGKSVPFLKMKGDWKLDIGLDDIGSAFIDELTDSQTDENVTSKENPMNMDYKDYLNLLLLAVPKETKLMRICDLIELNLAKSVAEDFNISDVYTGIACDVTVSFSPIVSPAFFEKGSGKRKYEMRFVHNSIY